MSKRLDCFVTCERSRNGMPCRLDCTSNKLPFASHAAPAVTFIQRSFAQNDKRRVLVVPSLSRDCPGGGVARGV
jgi:hypothetical protein